MKKKVLFTASIYGHFTAFHLPFMEMLQRDFGVQVWASARRPVRGSARETLAEQGVVCADVPFSRSPLSLRNLAAYRELTRLLRRENFDLIHTHTPMASFVCRLAAARAGGTPVLYTAHGFHFTQQSVWWQRLLYESAERAVSKMTAGLIVMNSEDWDSALRMGFTPGHSLFCTHGVGVTLPEHGEQERGSFRREMGIADDVVVVSCVAYLQARKNHRFLLKAWSQVEQSSDRAVLLIVGDGSLRRELESLSGRLNLKNVVFTGTRKDIMGVLADTDVLTLVSRQEGLPRCIMEAMSMARPVVASDIRGNRDLVEDGKTGILVPLGQSGYLCRALLRLINDGDLRRSMGLAGQQKVKDYSLSVVLEEMSHIYRHFLD